VIKVNVIGLKEIQAKLKNAPVTVKSQVSGAVTRGAQIWVRNAKRDAPVDLGVLRNLITHYPVGPLSQEIVSGARYSAYLEWGTITKVMVPGELQVYAALFKGKGLRKNGGIFPRPYFFKQRPLAVAEIERGIKAIKL
jgi:hypothetical protein